mgnify:FL=1
MLDVEDYISETAIVLDKHRDYEVLTGIKWYFIELPKFRKAKPDMNEKINQWLAFIDDDNKEMIDMAENKNKTLKDARKEMNYLTGDAEVKRLAELREKWEMDRINAISYATKVGKEERRKKQKYRNSKKTIKNRNDNWRNNKSNRPIQIRNWKTKIVEIKNLKNSTE